MSEPKFTKGPWNCNRASAGGREIVVSEVSPVDIAVLSRRDKTQSEIDANAHLIAAAPDLYAALDMLLLQCGEWDSTHDIDDKTYEEARVALAKARGEA